MAASTDARRIMGSPAGPNTVGRSVGTQKNALTAATIRARSAATSRLTMSFHSPATASAI
jgi:hypothetical protein